MVKPDVLVAIPTYNNAAHGYTLRYTLEALTKQSYDDFDLLIVYKPAPGDNTLNMIREFSDLDIRIADL